MIPHNNLEEFQDPANYDLEEAELSAPQIAFTCDLAEAVGGPVLEIACGTGLVTLPVAARGLNVTGLDLARPMLDHARFKAQQQGLSIDWVEADARHFDLGRRFAFIYLTGNAFQAFLTLADQTLLLASVKRHLDVNGVFAFETRNPSGYDLRSFPKEEADRSYTSAAGHRVSISYSQDYDPVTQIMHWTTFRHWHDGAVDQETVTRIACRFTDPRELQGLLRANGFRIVEQFGDWNKETLTAASPSIITLCVG